MMKEITPYNVLDKLGMRVKNYSGKEIELMKNKNYMLCRQLNQLVNKIRTKKQKLELLRAQL